MWKLYVTGDDEFSSASGKYTHIFKSNIVFIFPFIITQQERPIHSPSVKER